MGFEKRVLQKAIKTEQFAILFNSGLSVSDVYARGYNYSHYRDAKERGLLTTRTTEERSALVRRKNPNRSMGPEARARLSERQSLANTGGRCKWFKINNVCVQGTWERDVALKMTQLGIKWERPKTNQDIWKYTDDKGKVRSYCPDFYLPDADCWLEIKGHWWGDDKRKMEIVTHTYPQRRIVVLRETEIKQLMQGELVW